MMSLLGERVGLLNERVCLLPIYEYSLVLNKVDLYIQIIVHSMYVKKVTSSKGDITLCIAFSGSVIVVAVSQILYLILVWFAKFTVNIIQEVTLNAMHSVITLFHFTTGYASHFHKDSLFIASLTVREPHAHQKELSTRLTSEIEFEHGWKNVRGREGWLHYFLSMTSR